MLRMRDRFQEVLKVKAKTFFSFETAVLEGKDPEAIHDMRVASRRLQEILRLGFSGDSGCEKVIKVVRRARRIQSGVRDLDVMIEYFRKTRKYADAVTRQTLRFIEKDLSVRRKRRFRKMVRSLRSLRLDDLRTDLERLIRGFGEGQDRSGIPEPAITRAKILLRAQSQIADREVMFVKALDVAREVMKTENLHNARIVTKRLRYILEISDELRLGSFKRRIARMREIQEALGTWHDLEVLEETAIRMLSNHRVFQQNLPFVRAGCDLISDWREKKHAQVEVFLKITEP